MENCVTIPLLLLQIFVFLLTCGVILFQDFNKQKNTFDNSNKRYRFFQEYWPDRWDDVLPRWMWGALGALLAGELGLWAIEQFTSIPEEMHGHLDLSLIAFCTYFAPKIFIKNAK